MKTPGHLVYVVSWFPAITETFIVNELLELRRRGWTATVFPLRGARSDWHHPGGGDIPSMPVAFTSFALWAAHAFFLLSHPLRYALMWRTAVLGNRASMLFVLGGIYAALKAPYFAKEALRLGAQHIHAHWANHPACAAMLMHVLTRLPFSFTAHAHDLYVDRTMLPEKVKASRFVATISDFNKRLIASECPAVADKVHVVRCGARLDRFQPEKGNKLATPFTFLCVASLRDYKGHAHLLDACALLNARGVEYQLLLVGEGELRPALEAQIARLSLGDHVRLLGAKSHDAVARMLPSAHAAVLASVQTASGKMEGIPVFLMEALACALPVVATEVSGVRELVEPAVTGLLVPQRNAEALADAMERLTRDRGLGAKLGAAGRERVLSCYALESNVERLHRLLLGEGEAARAGSERRPRSNEARSGVQPEQPLA